jgi:NADH:ubiquinone oxidoreductase subunit 3 (subunit A)
VAVIAPEELLIVFDFALIFFYEVVISPQDLRIDFDFVSRLFFIGFVWLSSIYRSR